MRQTSYDQATAIIHAVDDAELVIAKALQAAMGRTRDLKERAHAITQALDEAGFWVRYRPIDLVPHPASVSLGGVAIQGETFVLDEHDEAAILAAASESEDAPGYGKALAMLRGSRIPGVAQVAEALGEASPNGPEGNIWKLLDQRYATTRLGRGLFTDESIRRDVMEVRDGMLRVRPGSPIALLFADLDTLMQRGGKPKKLELRAGAVRDLIEAHRLIANATDILGHDAVDEILNNLADPVRGEAA